MASKLVSILIPCYQEGIYLEQTLEQVVQQSYRNLEIIVSDEGVDPLCEQLGRQFALRDPRVTYFKNTAPLGMTANWNAALGRCRGDYILKLDGDDGIELETISLLVTALEANDQVNVAACLALNCDERLESRKQIFGLGGYEKAGLNPYQDILLSPDRIYPFLFADYQLWHSCALLFSREVLDELNGWDETWGCASDTDIILRLLEAGEKIAHCGFPGIRYRIRSGSVSDGFRKSSALQWEGTVIHLMSLARWYDRRRKLTKPIKVGWYLFWSRLKALLKSQASCAEYPEYEKIAKTINPPPRYILLGEHVRRKLHQCIRAGN